MQQQTVIEGQIDDDRRNFGIRTLALSATVGAIGASIASLSAIANHKPPLGPAYVIGTICVVSTTGYCALKDFVVRPSFSKLEIGPDQNSVAVHAVTSGITAVAVKSYLSALAETPRSPKLLTGAFGMMTGATVAFASQLAFGNFPKAASTSDFSHRAWYHNIIRKVDDEEFLINLRNDLEEKRLAAATLQQELANLREVES